MCHSKFVAVAVLVLCSGCFTLTNMKTGEVTPPGRLGFGLGGTFLGDSFAPMFEGRFAPLPRWDLGLRWDYICMNLDTRLQIFADESDGFDTALEFGLGSTFWVLPRPYVYGGFAISKRLDKWTPYFHFRYIDIAMYRTDVQEEEDTPIVAELLTYLPPEMDELGQLSIGVEFRPGGKDGKLALIPEVLMCPKLKDSHDNMLTVFNLGLRFRFW